MNEDAKKSLLRAVPHGLYIVTSGEGDKAHGFTATWLTQASFKPPQVAIGVRRDSHAFTVISETGAFVVNFLAKDGRPVAEAFFKPPRSENGKLGAHAFRAAPLTGAPILEAALGFLGCQVRGSLGDGDHALFLGEVVEAEAKGPVETLVLADTPWKYGG
jgi:flavin reductase (DIM6/NTAB) family NADH-FMN oxidoreductase RutF